MIDSVSQADSSTPAARLKPLTVNNLQAKPDNPPASTGNPSQPSATLSNPQHESTISSESLQEILDSITKQGTALTENAAVRHIVANRDSLTQIINVSSGLPRIQNHVASRFQLILSSPLTISRHEQRCCFCQKMIVFPCWYWSVKYAVNVFHYFICFDSNSPDKPSTRCYKRG